DHGDFRSTPVNGHSQDRRECLKGANRRHGVISMKQASTEAALLQFACSYEGSNGAWHWGQAEEPPQAEHNGEEVPRAKVSLRMILPGCYGSSLKCHSLFRRSMDVVAFCWGSPSDDARSLMRLFPSQPAN